MRRKIVISIVVLLAGASVGLFAAEKRSPTSPWASYNSPGTIDLGVTGGLTWWGLGLNAGVEYTIGQFDLGTVPLSWGITAEGSGASNVSGIGVAFAALATVNVGLDFGNSLRFEGFIGLGPGGLIETWGGAGSGFGLAEYAGWTWWLLNGIGLTAEEGYVTAFGWGHWYLLGIGLRVRI